MKSDLNINDILLADDSYIETIFYFIPLIFKTKEQTKK